MYMRVQCPPISAQALERIGHFTCGHSNREHFEFFSNFMYVSLCTIKKKL